MPSNKVLVIRLMGNCDFYDGGYDDDDDIDDLRELGAPNPG